MARSVAVIYAQLYAAKQAQPNLNTLNSTSQVSTFNLWIWITAAGQALSEQLMDTFIAVIQAIVNAAPVFSPQWYQNQLLNWQYSATTPQVVSQSPSYSVYYAVVNASLRIITQAAVIPVTNRSVNVKVASNYTPLTSPQISALKSFLTAIGIPGTQFNIISENADQLFCAVTAYYDASYSGVIGSTLLAAYNNFLASIPFNGTFEVSQLQAALLAVPGMKDLEFNTLQAIPAVGSPVYLVETIGGNSTLINREWSTIAGYIVDDETSGDDFLSNLTLVAA